MRKFPINFYADNSVNEAKVARLLAVMEANIDADVAAENSGYEYLPGTDIRISGSQPKKRPKPNYPYPPEVVRALAAELTYGEDRELDRRCREKAKEAWRNGDNYRKSLWGGW